MSFLYLCPKLTSLTLRGNPIAGAADYRYHNFQLSTFAPSWTAPLYAAAPYLELLTTGTSIPLLPQADQPHSTWQPIPGAVYHRYHRSGSLPRLQADHPHADCRYCSCSSVHLSQADQPNFTRQPHSRSC